MATHGMLHWGASRYFRFLRTPRPASGGEDRWTISRYIRKDDVVTKY
jgi:hypothetical protein